MAGKEKDQSGKVGRPLNAVRVGEVMDGITREVNNEQVEIIENKKNRSRFELSQIKYVKLYINKLIDGEPSEIEDEIENIESAIYKIETGEVELKIKYSVQELKEKLKEKLSYNIVKE